MATGRTLDKFKRVYMDGYDLSGFGRSVEPLELTYDEHDLTAYMADQVKGYQRGHAHVNLGVFNAVFDNTVTTGLHALAQGAGIKRNVIVAQGIQAAPAAGDPAFCGQFIQKAYQVVTGGGVTVTILFSGWAADAASLLYAGAWGDLLHANGAVTGGNTGNSGISSLSGGQTLKGGYFIYQILAGNGDATLSVDDSANNSTWLALAGATSGLITCAAGVSGLVALANNATVRQYLRWQLALGTATSVNFISAFVRAY